MFDQYAGTAQVALPGERIAEIFLMETRSTRPDVRASLYVSTHRQAPCLWGSGICSTDHASGFVSLSDEQVDFDRSLGGASVTDVPVTLVSYVIGTEGYREVEEHVTISVALSGSGPVSRSADHEIECPMGGECQSIRVEASRAAVAEATLGDDEVSGAGRLFRGHSVNAAAPKLVHDGS